MTRAQPRRVWDAFIFFNEIEVLRLRLHTLSHAVHRFVLSEGTRTFSNKPKELLFQSVLDHDVELAAYLPQIEHVVVDDLPWGTGSQQNWDREFHSRNALLRGTAGIPVHIRSLISLW